MTFGHVRAVGSLVVLTSVLACQTSASTLPLRVPAPDDASSGITLYRQGKYTEAEAALKGKPGSEANTYYAASLVRQKKYTEAEASAKTAVAEAPTHEVAVASLGEVLVGLKKYDEAADKMTGAIGAKKDQSYAYYWRAQAYQAKKQPDRMVEDFETFLKLAPNAPEAPTVRQILAGLR